MVNIVFLILVFFIFAGTLAPALDQRVQPAELVSEEDRPPEGELLQITRAGAMIWNGQPISENELSRMVTRQGRIHMKILADRRFDASALVKLVNNLRSNGVRQVRIITLREN